MLKIVFLLICFIELIASFNSNVREFKNSVLLINQGIYYFFKIFQIILNNNQHNSIDNVILNTPDDEVSFFAIGDWGGLPVFPFKTIIEQSTSGSMTSLAKFYNTKFQMALGDNFYFDGVKNVKFLTN